MLLFLDILSHQTLCLDLSSCSLKINHRVVILSQTIVTGVGGLHKILPLEMGSHGSLFERIKSLLVADLILDNRNQFSIIAKTS